MRRSALIMTWAALFLAALTPAVAAQDGPELNVQCVTFVGDPTTEVWDEFSLQDAVAAGTAELTEVAAGADCAVMADGAFCMTLAGGAPATGWTRDTLTEAIGTGRAQIVLLAGAEECAQVIAETVDPVDAPERLPLQVLDSAVIIGDFSSSYVAIVTNPNPEVWAAQGLPIMVSVLGKAGTEIEATSSFVTLLPGQTGAVYGFLTTDEKPKRVELTFEGADFNWIPTELPADVLTVGAVKRKKEPVMGFNTRGQISNGGEVPVSGVAVYVLHRDKAGEIIGAELTLVDSVPAGGSATFEVPNLSGVRLKRIAETEVYYQLSSAR